MVFPEAWLAGYPYWTEGWDSPLPQWAEGRILFWDNALVVPSEDSERIAHAVRRAGVYVALGCNEMDPRPEVHTIYNSLVASVLRSVCASRRSAVSKPSVNQP